MGRIRLGEVRKRRTWSSIIIININIIALIALVWLGKIDDRIKKEVEVMNDTRFL
jgi:hypothetical protein